MISKTTLKQFQNEKLLIFRKKKDRFNFNYLIHSLIIIPKFLKMLYIY